MICTEKESAWAAKLHHPTTERRRQNSRLRGNDNGKFKIKKVKGKVVESAEGG